MPSLPTDVAVFNRIEQGRTEAFDCLVQFVFSGVPYVMMGVASSAISLLGVDTDRYDCIGRLHLIQAAQGHTLAINTGLTSDLVPPNFSDTSPNAIYSASERTAIGSAMPPAPVDGVGSISLGHWIRAKVKGDRVRALVREVFVDKTDEDLTTQVSEVANYARQANRFEGVVDIQGANINRGNGGEVSLAMQGRIIETDHFSFARSDADEDTEILRRSPDRSRLDSEFGSIRAQIVALFQKDATHIVAVFDSPLDADGNSYAVSIDGAAFSNVASGSIDGEGTQVHTIQASGIGSADSVRLEVRQTLRSPSKAAFLPASKSNSVTLS